MKIFTLAVFALSLASNIVSGIRHGFDWLLTAATLLAGIALCLNIAVLIKEKK